MTERPPSIRRLIRLGARAGRAVHGAYYYIPALHRRTTPLLILGHMRCGSTLLAHLLNSHPEIAGYGETHRTYLRRRDLWTLRAHVFLRQPTARIRARYVTDKNVNEVFPVDPSIFARPPVRLVLIAREPEASLSSLLTVLSDWSEEQALSHYHHRMDLLQRSALAADPSRVFFLTHHQLLHHSREVLYALTRFLELSTPLSERYETTERTGTWGWGDTTERIHAGHIVRNYERPKREWTSNVLAQAERAYEATVDGVRLRCAHASAPFGPAEWGRGARG